MPCKAAKARILLRDGKAVVRHRTPFTIQLTIATGENTQPISLGADSGYKHVGLSASTAKRELYASEVILRDDIPGLLEQRASYRRDRRSRTTRYREPRFDNRVRHSKHEGEGWLPPSVENRINAHVSRIDEVMSLLPVTSIAVEIGAFDIQKIENPEISGKEYQQGEQLGFWNVREYVLYRDNHTCQICHGKSGDKVLQVHHIESRRTGGDSPKNLVTLCKTCHEGVHAGTAKLKKKRGKPFKAETFMNIMRCILLGRLQKKYPDIKVSHTFGYITKHTRIEHHIAKTHCADAFCIAGNMQAVPLDYYFIQRQTRKHNRRIHKDKIYEGGERRYNQAPYINHGYRLFDKVLYNGMVVFITGRKRDSNTVILRTIEWKKVAEISSRKLKLLEKRKTFLIDIRKK